MKAKKISLRLSSVGFCIAIIAIFGFFLNSGIASSVFSNPWILVAQAATGDQIFQLVDQITAKKQEVDNAASSASSAANAAAAKTNANKALAAAKAAISAGDSLSSAAKSAYESVKTSKPTEAQQFFSAIADFDGSRQNNGQEIFKQEALINSGNINQIKEGAKNIAERMNDYYQTVQKVAQAAQGAGFTPPAGTAKPTTAATTAPKAGATFNLYNPLGSETRIPVIAGRVINMFMGIVGALALLVFVFAGIVYMTAGSSERVTKAKDTLKYAVLGLLIIMFSYTMTDQFIQFWTTRYVPAEEPAAARTTDAGPTQASQETTSLEQQAQKKKEEEAAAAEAAKTGGVMSCDYYIHQKDPSDTASYSCKPQTQGSVYVCSPVRVGGKNICPEGSECCRN